MNKRNNLLFALLGFLSVSLFTSCDDDDGSVIPVVKPDLAFYGLSNTNELVRFNAAAVETAISNMPITGLPTGEKIIAIDFRPATGQLYGLGNLSRLYIINTNTGAATAVGTTFSSMLNGSYAGFDFNPTVDRIRVVTNGGQNLRLHPETGAVAATDANINPAAGGLVGVAYTNSVAGATSTTLFDIDLASGKLYKQDPPNNGTLVEVGSLGVTPAGATENGFDISPDNAVALVNLTVGAANALYQVDLTNGKVTNLGNFPLNIIGIAIPTPPVAYTVDGSNNLQIFNVSAPAAPVSKAITGLQPAESILGIDMRPATGQLYALGSTSRLYTINLATGAASAVGAGPFTPVLAGTSFAFDFNPTVDRIRVISNLGQNLRLNPVDGTVAATDGMLNPGTPAVSAAAYTNNFPGATTTTLFDIDPVTDKLYTQNPPNNGTLVEVGSLGINIETDNGFDIGGTSNKAYAIATVAGVTRLYSINLTTGMATELAAFPNTIRGFAVGAGF